MKRKDITSQLDWIRKSIIGRNQMIQTPFGKKPLVYADYTASGRSIDFIEDKILSILPFYANSHTEDDLTGKTMTTLMHQSESIIKRCVNAGSSGKVLFTGTGATGAITKLQQILGVFLPPATLKRINQILKEHTTCTPSCFDKITTSFKELRPIVFVGPYEHHSNEIMWRQSLCEVKEIPLNADGDIDLITLEKEVSNPAYKDRVKIGSFSAASNVSGLISPTYKIAKILHKHNAFACFDFAASGPYVEINMNYDNESYFDAIFVSVHKFLGGPGASGLLVFNERIYDHSIPPSVAAGGTVDYVTEETEKFNDDIEARENPGTPGILQAIRAGIAFDLKDKIGVKAIEELEHHFFKQFEKRFSTNPKLKIYGPTDSSKRLNIISFNIIHEKRILHPKFVTKLFNDLFGIQTRAGCSCAGPYGHRLLRIDKLLSDKYINLINKTKYFGMKPGWVRLNLHYSFDQEEINYLFDAIDFIVEHGHSFLHLYQFDFNSGEWSHIHSNDSKLPISLEMKKLTKSYIRLKIPKVSKKKRTFVNYAYKIINNAEKCHGFATFEDELEEMMFFHVINYGR